ncbi:MAG: DUF4831 family protein [Bacteroidales bacterium]|nr:DUF4831 family protein [Bacteroidales bacterium]
MGKKVKFALLVFVVTTLSCSTSSVTTTNLRDLAKFEPNAIIYALPQTSLVVTVTAEKKVFIPGPYHKYAKEFLGIENTVSAPSTSWSVTGLKLSTVNEPDPEHFYSVKIENHPDALKYLSDFSNNGLIMPPCSGNSFQLSHNHPANEVDAIQFTDLTIKPFVFLETQKKQKNVLEEPGFALVPSLEKHLSAKSEKEKAFEAAQFILKIRKRRFKLISGQYEVFPEGIALQEAVCELNKLENEYVSLFIGKYQADTISQIFSVTPQNNQTLQRFTLFRFSPDTGIIPPSGSEGTPIVLEIKDLNQNNLLNQLQMPSVSAKSHGLFYQRLPDKCTVSVFHNSHILLEAELPVYQLGAVVPFYIQSGHRNKKLIGRPKE